VVVEIYRLPFLKERCPRCNGNLYFDIDNRKFEVHCLQCGYTRELDELKKAVMKKR